MPRRFWVLLTTVLLAAVISCTPGFSPRSEPDSTISGSSAQPDYQKLEASIEDSISNGSRALTTIEAVMVSVDGGTVINHYRNGRRPDQVLHMWSVTKSVTSALIGIALGDKLIGSLDQTLAELLPRYRPQMSVEMAGVTLRQLMDMSAGFADERMTPSILTDVFDHDGDAVAFILKRGLASPPGEAFAYSSSASHLVTAVLAAALERVDGVKPRSVLDYAEEKLFKPLEIDARNAFSSRFRPSKVSEFERAGFGWGTDAQGLHSGCCLLRLRPVDMVKIGELYLGDGVWHGRRVLPMGWVAASTATSQTNPQYGLMWWLDVSTGGGPAYLARGAAGQLIIVAPQDRLVVVVGSMPTEDYATDDEDVYALVSSIILPAFA